jgi:hypothetical protein
MNTKINELLKITKNAFGKCVYAIGVHFSGLIEIVYWTLVVKIERNNKI